MPVVAVAAMNSTYGVPGSRNSGQVTLDAVTTLALAVSSSDMVVALKLT